MLNPERRSEPSFAETMDRLGAVVGADNVRASSEEIERRSRCTIPWARRCRLVVYPGSTEEVQRVVRIAGEVGLPVWAFSKGKNWGYGTTMAAHDGALILILERMNRIVEVNEELAYAVIEPGVTQGQLSDHLRASGIPLWTDCTDSTPEGSLLGNALERGVGYTAYGDHFGHLCGLEVVLPSGDLVRTGGGPENSATFHTYKWGTGPYLEGLFSQSNFGIVTRAGLWLMPAPEAFNCFVAEVFRDEDFPAVVDTVRRLALGGVLRTNVHMVNDFLFLTVLTQYPYERRQGQMVLPEEVRADLRRRFALTPWTMVGGLYGTAAQVRVNRAHVKRALGGFGKITFLDDSRVATLERMVRALKRARRMPLLSAALRPLKDALLSPAPLEAIEVIPQVYAVLKGIPGDVIVRSAYFKSRHGRPAGDVDPARDGCGLMWFAPVVPASARHAQEVVSLGRDCFRKHGLEFSMSFILLNPRSVLALMQILYDRDDPAETERASALYDELTETTLRAGYPQYRTSVAYMDRILACAPAYGRLAEAIKQALDPVGVMAPGRYGIGKAPRTARERRGG